MTSRVDTAATTLASVSSPDDDPLPDDDPGCARDLDTGLEEATIARLRVQARRTRPRIERRLADAGFLPAASAARAGDDGQRDLDWRRDLDGRLDEHVAFLEQIDALHDRRLRSPSPRERQAATRALAEAMYRIVDGYWVDDGPPHRPVQAVRRLDDAVGRAYARLAVAWARPAWATRTWARTGRWVRLALAGAAALALAQGLLAWGAVAVVVRAVLSLAFVVTGPPESPRRRLLGYNAQWASCVCTHIGDAAVLAASGLALHAAGRPAWGALTGFAALFGLTATMTRVAASSQGFRLPRMYLDRLAKAVALPVAAVGAAVSAPTGVAEGVPAALAAVVVVIAVALSDLVRIVYWAVRRRRLFRRVGAAGGGLVPDVIVARTSDALVMNITRAEPRATVFDGRPDGAGERYLRAVGDAPTPARRGRADRRTSGRGRHRA
jgi:hypothetical protein